MWGRRQATLNELVSALIHLLGATAFLLAAPGLLSRAGSSLRLAAALQVFGTVFLFAFSGLYHMAVFALPYEAVTESFRRLDHIGIWLIIAALFLLPHLLVFKRGWRWVPLAIVWAAAGAGVLFKLFWFGQLTLQHNFVIYAAVSFVGVVSIFEMTRRHGLRFTRFLVACYACAIFGALFFMFRPPDLVPGLFGHHEMWHVGILAAAACHWRFTFDLLVPGRALDVDCAPCFASASTLAGPSRTP